MQNRSRLKEVQDLLIQMDSKELLQGYIGQSIACQQHDSRKYAPQIQAPTLVIVGKDDMITPVEASRDLADAIPTAELVIFPRGGHGFWREFPMEVNPIIHEFLLRH
jgi:pimeloyl-ACP methyl ester carboxylesterase